MSNKNIISIKNLHFSRGKRVIFDGVDVDIKEGKITAIMGPSGTGKTTLLKLIGGQLKPESGKIYFREKNIPDLSSKSLYQVRKQMGMLFQSGALLTDMTVFENVAFPLREHTDLPDSMIYALVLLKLQTVGLRGAKDLMPSELSGGMARRVALARAMVLDPDVIMYDEPFAGQDPISMGVLLKLIKQVNQLLGITSIIVSHDVHETLAIADWIYVLAEGKIVGQGTPEQMKNTSSTWVHQFIQGEDDGPVHFHYPAKNMLDDLLDFSA
ncbi:MAG: ATP-binding cassette domain-containing protein [Pseudomonadota bacterium]